MAVGETRGRRTKYAMMRLRKLQEEKVDEAERSFAILAELAQMEKLPKDWDARRTICNDVMNRVWGTPKTKSELTGKDGEPLFDPNKLSIFTHGDDAAP